MHLTKEETLIKRFRTLAKGNKVPILDERITAENISEDLAFFDLDCTYPTGWSEMCDVEQALFTIDNSQICRDWIRQHYIVG